MPGIRDGSVHYWQNLSEYVCEQCDLRAVPLWFDDLDSYEAFRLDKQGKIGTPAPELPKSAKKPQ